jgi:XTP/dITP diphosphohydrolase
VELVSLADLGVDDEIAEDGATFDENATRKALGYAGLANQLVLADDSGLEVDVLAGAPGVRTRRFAAPDATDEQNNAHLLTLLEGVPPDRRTARYRCTLVLARPDRVVAVTHGTLEGRIARSPRGTGGFGYDPIFEPDGQPPGGRTLAEYMPVEKNAISHRGRAARAMLEELARLDG